MIHIGQDDLKDNVRIEKLAEALQVKVIDLKGEISTCYRAACATINMLGNKALVSIIWNTNFHDHDLPGYTGEVRMLVFTPDSNYRAQGFILSNYCMATYLIDREEAKKAQQEGIRNWFNEKVAELDALEEKVGL